MMSQFAALFIGDASWPEFADCHDWLARRGELRMASNIGRAIELLDNFEFEPLLIVLAQAWPGQFGASDLEALVRRAPLARISELLGGWCEGQTRTGEPLAGAVPCYWHQWIARMQPELERLESGDFSVWGLPPTASDEERLLALPTARPKDNRGLITIHTASSELAGSLYESAKVLGYGTVWIRGQKPAHITGARAVICDLPAAPRDTERMTAIRSQHAEPGSSLIAFVALTAFPRADDRERLLAAGATLVVSKPFWLDDLFGQLADAC